ncbi:hypothetical protein EJ110_NYTH06820 [Nymphaea thermarum]|nr:hypothetical protein EJ110_NYTH06820 [Nymphaea thermarum]
MMVFQFKLLEMSAAIALRSVSNGPLIEALGNNERERDDDKSLCKSKGASLGAAENPCVGVCSASNSGSTEHPPLSEAVALICSLGIKKLRVLHPDHDLLKALVNTGVEVSLGIPNEDLRDLALSSEHAWRWVSHNIKPYLSTLKIRYISVVNEGIMGEERHRLLVLPAMKNVHKKRT